MVWFMPTVMERLVQSRENIALGVLPPIAVQNDSQSGARIVSRRQLGRIESFHAVTVARRLPDPLPGTSPEGAHSVGLRHFQPHLPDQIGHLAQLSGQGIGLAPDHAHRPLWLGRGKAPD